MEKVNIPLSCTRGLHFTRKVGLIDQCFYCKNIIVSIEANMYPTNEDYSRARDVILRNIDKEQNH